MSISVAIVIPAYREASYIEKTLHSIEKSVQFSIEKNWLPYVIVVVNNPIFISESFRKDNLHIIRSLQDLKSELSFPLDVLDYTDPGIKNGVGEARKIGMDYAIAKYLKNPHDLIVSLDADCLVDLNYIATIFQTKMTGSAFTLPFEHLLDSSAIIYYELYLRYLRWVHLLSGSPFSHYSVGSCFGTDVENYSKSGGMPPKSATEDFHFLNKLRKRGPIQYLTGTTICPSSRLSERVTLGTGYFLTNAKAGLEKTFVKLMIPHPDDFKKLKKVISIFDAYDGNRSLGDLFTINDVDEIYQDLYSRGFIEKVYGIFDSTTTQSNYRSRLLEVMDGLETLRILRSMSSKRNHTITTELFLTWANELWSTSFTDPQALLEEIRKRERATQ
jgi:glycosyltransferase involved in cell wall biosynthesis